jgi:type I restriction enzyme R subunit
MLESAGWAPGQVARGVQLTAAAEPPSVSRSHHHGSREDRVAYVLSSRPGTPTAVVATVGAQHRPETGLRRAIRQAAKLDAAIAYATNGVGLIEHFVASGKTQATAALASPSRAWRSYLRLHHLRRVGAELVAQGFDQQLLSDAAGPVTLRHYQTAAVNRALGAISRDQRRVLIQLAPHSGTTVVSVALMAKFAGHETGAHPEGRRALVYIDDRPVGESTPQTLAAVRRLAQATPAPLTIAALGDCLNRAAAGDVGLIVVNLAHGGQAADGSAWRDTLDAFPDAYQVGIVGAPPAKAGPVFDYFGRPVYRYTAEQARADGYAPAIAAGAPDPAESGPEEIDFESALAPARRRPDPAAVAVQIRRSVAQAKLAAGQQALAARLVSLMEIAQHGGRAARAAARVADELTELEILAELEDQVGGEPAVRRHIALLRQLLTGA